MFAAIVLIAFAQVENIVFLAANLDACSVASVSNVYHCSRQPSAASSSLNCLYIPPSMKGVCRQTVVLRGQALFHKTQGKLSAQIQIVLMRYFQVSTGRFQIVRDLFFIDWVQFRNPVDLTGSSETKARCSIGAPELTKSNASDRNVVLIVTIFAF